MAGPIRDFHLVIGDPAEVLNSVIKIGHAEYLKECLDLLIKSPLRSLISNKEFLKFWVFYRRGSEAL